LYCLYWNRSIYATVAILAVVALVAVGAIIAKRKQTNTRPSPVVRSPLVAGVYKVTFKVILISYQYYEIKLQNLFTFLGWGRVFCLAPGDITHVWSLSRLTILSFRRVHLLNTPQGLSVPYHTEMWLERLGISSKLIQGPIISNKINNKNTTLSEQFHNLIGKP
jgi:hypothetical protein